MSREPVGRAGIEAGPTRPGPDALDLHGRFERGEAFGAHLDTLLCPRSADDRGAEYGRVARRGYRRADARKRRPSHGAMGRARAHYWQVLEHGVRIFERPGPFDHSKLMLVDGAWCCLGSANWDARSLRLNFEFNGGGVRHRVVYAAVIPF